MSIAFESEEVRSQKLRERLRKMSDEELIKFGKDARKLSEPSEWTWASAVRCTTAGEAPALASAVLKP